jgi:hypothetical protein
LGTSEKLALLELQVSHLEMNPMMSTQRRNMAEYLKAGLSIQISLGLNPGSITY